ncbi:MAG: hypothetical protein H7831_04635 [Magnetococcus sp. WYHC-3]
MKSIIAVSAVSLLLAACGGGGGGSSANVTANTTVFSHSTARTYDSGYNKTITVNASDNRGYTYSGTVSATTTDNVSFNNNVTVRGTMLTAIQRNDGAWANGTSYSYYSRDPADRRVLGMTLDTRDNASTYYPLDTHALPTTATPGASGSFGNYTNTTGSTAYGSWSLDAGTNGNGILRVIWRHGSDMTYQNTTITPTGDIVTLEGSSTIGNFTVTMTGQ